MTWPSFLHSFRRRMWVAIIVVVILSQLLFVLTVLMAGIRPASGLIADSIITYIVLTDATLKSRNPDTITQLKNQLAKVEWITIVEGERPVLVEESLNTWKYPVIGNLLEYLHAHLPEDLKVEGINTRDRVLWIRHSKPPVYNIGIRISSIGVFYKLLMVIFLFFLLSAVSAHFFASRSIRPLLALTEDAARIGHNREYFISVQSGAVSEIKNLANVLNQMRSNIDTMIRRREKYLAEIAHDIRTPLSRIRIAVEMLPEDTKGLHGIIEDIDEMHLNLEQAIELARLDSEVNEAWYQGDLNELIRNLAAKYERSNIHLDLHLSDIPKISYKPLGLTRIIYNLIDNGLRHGTGQVSLSTDCTTGYPRLVLQNFTAEENLGRIISPLLGNQSSGGVSGLGNAIVKRLAEVHGAHIEHKTIPPNKREVLITFGLNPMNSIPVA